MRGHDSNVGHGGYEPPALPTELPRQTVPVTLSGAAGPRAASCRLQGPALGQIRSPGRVRCANPAPAGAMVNRPGGRSSRVVCGIRRPAKQKAPARWPGLGIRGARPRAENLRRFFAARKGPADFSGLLPNYCIVVHQRFTGSFGNSPWQQMQRMQQVREIPFPNLPDQHGNPLPRIITPSSCLASASVDWKSSLEKVNTESCP